MSNIITISELSFHYKDHTIFNNLSLNIKKGTSIAIIGRNGSGKSTLIKILLGLLKYDGTIKIDDELLTKENYKNIRKKIGVVFENPDNQFVAQTVMDDIAFTLENMNYPRKEIQKKIEEIANYIGISDILNKNPHNLSGGQKQLVSLASALVHDPSILILDEALTMIDTVYKDHILEILKNLKKKNMTIILVTHDMEEAIFMDEIVLLDNQKILLKGPKEKVFKEEKIFHDLGFHLPFIIELSNRLEFYQLIDHTFYNMEQLVDVLWK